MTGRPLPDTSDPLSARAWAACAEGRLEMQGCAACGHVRWPPAQACPNCLADGGIWRTLRGTGTLWSFAVYACALDPAFAADCPYAVGLVALDEGPMIHGRIAGPPAAVAIGQRLVAVFETLAPGIGVARFRCAAVGDTL